jgi:hypothetical protein
MYRIIVSISLFALTLGFVIAQDEIRRGTVKALDAEKGTVTITVNGKDATFFLTADSKVMVNGKLADKPFDNKELKPGSAVMFKATTKAGKDVLVGLKVGEQPGKGPAQPKFDSSKLKPLSELGTEKYQGYEGGFYPGGKNERPKEHNDAGLALAKAMQPLGTDGKPAANGKIVMISVGMSNTTQVFSTFKRIADADTEKNPALVLVDGAQGGMTADRIKDPDDKGNGTKYWEAVDQRLKMAGVTREQVQIAWIKQADAGPNQGFPKYAQTLRDELRQIVIAMKARFPNLKMVYLSSRTYGGYATTGLNPEPYAFESGFSVKWLIEEQLKGDKELNFDPKKGEVKAPWLSWGPYLWANGTTKNAEGLSYEVSDYGGDGTHPTQAGQKKVAEHMLKFFKNDPTTKPWFVK